MEKDNILPVSVDSFDDLKLPLQVDDIRHYGLKAQTSLESFSRSLAKAYLSARNDTTESLLLDVVAKLESLDNHWDPGSSRAPVKTKRYRILLQTIDELKLALQMEQIALIKEIRIYEKMKVQIDSCCKDLEQYLTQGEQHLSDIVHNQNSIAEQDEFIETFRRKLDELRTSTIIAEQGRVQLELMEKNAVSLENKIREAVLSTIPLWRNQVSLLFGIDKMKEKTKSFERLRKSADKGNLVSVSSKEIGTINADLGKALSEINGLYKALHISAQLLTNNTTNSIKEGGSKNGTNQ